VVQILGILQAQADSISRPSPGQDYLTCARSQTGYNRLQEIVQ